MKKNWNLEGFRAVVTGGTKGIGKSIVEELCSFGAEVMAVSRHAEDLQALTETQRLKGYKISGFRADISKAEELKNLIAHLKEVWPGVDILINNAGTNIRKKAEEYNQNEYNSIFNINLNAAFSLSVGLHDMLAASEYGSIVNISSVAGLNHMRTGVIYGMTKAALIQMTRNLAVEWAQQGIRVNAIAPWYINTPLADEVLKNKEYRDEVLGRTPMYKIGEPEDVASLAVFLCLPAARYITGQCIAVDGGITINLF